jgi:hypothetical protein
MFDQPPAVFTSRCCKLVSDQFSIRCGSASRRQSRAPIGDNQQQLLPFQAA